MSELALKLIAEAKKTNATSKINPLIYTNGKPT